MRKSLRQCCFLDDPHKIIFGLGLSTQAILFNASVMYRAPKKHPSSYKPKFPF
jgi:hypothetical protein